MQINFGLEINCGPDTYFGPERNFAPENMFRIFIGPELDYNTAKKCPKIMFGSQYIGLKKVLKNVGPSK